MWMTRTFNRYFGKMADKDGVIIDAPTEPERVVIKKFVNEVAKNAGIKPYQAQSVLWFYEQRLFRALGTPSASYGFSDGGRKFLEQSTSAGTRSGEEDVRGVKQKKSYSLRRYGAVSGEPISFNAKQPAAQTYVGVHYSNAEREYLSGSKSGTGIRGAEEKRLKDTKDLRIKKRVYFYIPKTQTEAYPNKEAGLGAFKHFQSFDNILGPGKEMARLYNESGAKEDNDFNLFESAIVNAGYDGYS
jgi:hypothetical protein